MNLDIYAFVSMPENEWMTEKEIYRERLYNMMDQLCGMSGKIMYRYVEEEISFISIALLESQKFKKEYNSIYKYKQIKQNNCELMKFSLFLEPNQIKYESYNSQIAILYFSKLVYEIILIANICMLGSIDYCDSVIMLDNNYYNILKLQRIDVWSLQRAYELIMKYNWPDKNDLGFLDGWNWHEKHLSYFDGFSINKTSRAINALSRIFTYEQNAQDYSNELLWAMIGIEALLTDGNGGIIEQVKEKLAILFNDSTPHIRKIINKMYNYRSRFVHGDIDFQSFGYFFDAAERFIKYTDEQMEAADISIAILVSTLQYIIRNNWSGMKFESIVKNDEI
jgi:hypothetical protein